MSLPSIGLLALACGVIALLVVMLALALACERERMAQGGDE